MSQEGRVICVPRVLSCSPGGQTMQSQQAGATSNDVSTAVVAPILAAALLLRDVAG